MRLFFVTPQRDPSKTLLENLIEKSTVPAKAIFAAPCNHRSDKISNQLAAIKKINNNCDVLVFFDSDGYALPYFLTNLVAPLRSDNHAVATAYRWFLLQKYSLPVVIAMMCGAIALVIQSNPLFTVPWGGAMAIKMADFNTLQVEKEWDSALYDDYVLGYLLRRAHLKASFVPFALVTNPPPLSVQTVIQEGIRHFRMLRITLFHHWLFSFATVLIAVFGPLILLALISQPESSLVLELRVIISLLLPILLSALMYFTISNCEDLSSLVGYQAIRMPRKFVMLAFLAPIIIFVQLLGSVFGRIIKWQNKVYEVMAYNRIRVLN